MFDCKGNFPETFPLLRQLLCEEDNLLRQVQILLVSMEMCVCVAVAHTSSCV